MDAAARWKVVSELFSEAMDQPAAERTAFVERRCADQGFSDDLLEEVLELIRDEERHGDGGHEDRLDRLFFSIHPTGDSEPAVGKRIGAYRLEALLGRGGMGAVYSAVRVDGQVEQRVAIKWLFPQLASPLVLERFQAERQILARLDHPNVARLLDVGTTDDGLPYLVMELVDGEPIDVYCRTKKLPVKERLGLFRDLCSAVSFAHRNLVVHRDIKPANVLVTRDGRVKLLDFGIARLLEGPQVTRDGPSPMTPPYASPEQIRGQEISTASDVYSLGVVLYELLTGRRPYEAEGELLGQAICEERPRRPSTVEIAPELRIDDEPRKLRRQLAGDLDNIVLRALRKEPERRFPSVEQLSEDIRRHLAGLPVLSGPESFTYWAGKFIRRHPWGVAAMATIVILAAAFAATFVSQSRRIAEQYQQLLQERQRSREALEFFIGVLGEGDPRRAKGSEPTVQEALETTLRRLTAELRHEPLTRASILDMTGRVYLSSGDTEAARGPLEEALRLRRAHLPAGDPQIAGSLHNLAGLERRQGRFEEALELIEEGLAIQRKAYPQGHPDLATGLSNAASLHRRQGDLEQAEGLSRQALVMQERLFGPSSIDVAITLNNRARILQDLGRYEAAEHAFLRSIEIRREVEGDRDPGLAKVLNNLGMLYVNRLNRLDDALPLYRESRDIRRHVYGRNHPELRPVLNNLGIVWTMKGRFEEAELAFDELFALYGDEAVPEYLRKNRLILLQVSGRPEECDREARDLRSALRLSPVRVAELDSIHGACLAALGQLNEAEPMLISGHTTLLEQLGPEERRTRQARERLALANGPGRLAPE